MEATFDPYHQWLGISPKDQPPSHYRLLAIDLFEADLNVISNAADQRMSHLRSFQTGKNGPLTQKLLNEIAAARVCLLNPEKKAEYDWRLREQLAPVPPPPLAAPTLDFTLGTELPHVPRARGNEKYPRHLLVIAVAAAAVCFVVVAVWMGSRKNEPRTQGQPPAIPLSSPKTAAAKTETSNDRTQAKEPSGRTVYLADLTPVESQTLDRERLPKILSVAGKQAMHGIIGHPTDTGGSRIVYELSPGFHTLTGLAAIADLPQRGLRGESLEGTGSPLTFKILGDGETLWTSRPLQRKTETQPFQIELGGVRQLELRVDRSGSHYFAWALWVDPVLR